MEKAIEWFKQRQGRVLYSMKYRMGPNSFDCSSSVYFSLIYAGILPQGHRIGTTSTMFTDLPKHGFVKIAPDANGNIDAQRGDIFVWSKSNVFDAGEDEHTGIFIDPVNIIDCRLDEGIIVDNHDALFTASGMRGFFIFRYTGTPAPVNRRKIKFNQPFRVDEIATVNGILQARLDGIVKDDFNWTENGVPMRVLEKLNQYDGEIYKINGEFEVLDEEGENGANYLHINIGEEGDIYVWDRALNNPIDLKIKLVAPEKEQPKKIETNPVEDKQVEAKPAENKPAENKPAENKPAENKPAENKPIVKHENIDELIKYINELENKRDKTINNGFEPIISRDEKQRVYMKTGWISLLVTMLAGIIAILLPGYTKEILGIGGLIIGACSAVNQLYKIGNSNNK